MYNLESVFLNKEVQIVQGDYHYDYMWQSQITVFTDAPSRPSYWCDEYNACRYRVKTGTSSNYYQTIIPVVYNSSYENYPYYYWYEIASQTPNKNVTGFQESVYEFELSGITQADFDNGLVQVVVNNGDTIINGLCPVSFKTYNWVLTFDNRVQKLTLTISNTSALANSYKITTLSVQHYKYFPEVV